MKGDWGDGARSAGGGGAAIPPIKMLDLLRKRASSWVIKITLLLITLSFALFFGYNQFGGDILNQKQAIARVGENLIPRQKFDLLLEDTLSRTKESFKEGMPKNIEEFLRQNLLDQLISQEVLFLYARSLGINASDEALAQEIQGNQNFSKNGVFDIEGYHQRFRPYYRRAYGEEFEDALRKDLIREKLFQLAQVSFEPWEKTLAKTLKEGESPVSSNSLLLHWITEFREQREIELY